MNAVNVRFYPQPGPRPLPELSANATLEEKIIAALRSVYDPEPPVNIPSTM